MSKERLPLVTSPSSSTSRYLRPERFNVEPATAASDLKWTHWRYSFENFLSEEVPSAKELFKYKLLVNHISPTIFNLIRECGKYTTAIEILDNTYEKRRNITLARHHLTSRKQELGESIAEYSRALTLLAHDCHFKAVTAKENQDETNRGTLIAGLHSKKIRERLLEKCTMTLEETLNLAISLESAESTSHAIETNASPASFNAVTEAVTQESPQLPPLSAAVSQNDRRRCFFVRKGEL